MATILSKNVKKPPFCHEIFCARETPISKKTRKKSKKRQNTGKRHIYKNPKVSQSHFLAKIDNFFTAPFFWLKSIFYYWQRIVFINSGFFEIISCQRSPRNDFLKYFIVQYDRIVCHASLSSMEQGVKAEPPRVFLLSILFDRLILSYQRYTWKQANRIVLLIGLFMLS
jgi:hypothetical protein